MSADLRAWVSGFAVPRGVGVDLVSVSRLRELDAAVGGALVRRTFTAAERAEAEGERDPWTYLAGRFAAKEAVFKAVDHLLDGRHFDFRQVETLRRSDGSPAVTVSGPMAEILARAGADRLLLSLSNEGDFAVALVMAAADCTKKDK